MLMKFDPSIFRAYDVRGIYGKTIDEEIMKKIGNGKLIYSALKLGSLYFMNDGLKGGKMPKVKIKGKTKHFPYTKAGYKAAAKAKKKQKK